MTWGEEAGDLTEKDISAEEQDRLLSEYERELLTKKMKNGGGGGEAKKGSGSAVEDSIGEELAKLDMKEKKKGAKGATPAGRKAVSPDKGMRGRVMCFLRFSREKPKCLGCSRKSRKISAERAQPTGQRPFR